jgi:uncharacterized membrane protein YsdA (DUF1294 family)
MKYLLIYLLAVNAATFVIYGIDKLKAKRGRWRISEATLLGLAVIGGSLGAWAAMYTFRHKTQHLKFKYGVPAIIVLQIAAVCYLCFR